MKPIKFRKLRKEVKKIEERIYFKEVPYVKS